MSATLLENIEGTYLTRLSGGQSRGTCFQITVSIPSSPGADYVVLTQRQMELVVAAYLAYRFDLPERKS